MYEGKAPELSATKSARMPAFFEHSNVNLPNMPDLNLLDVRGMTANAMLAKLEESFPPTNPTPEDSMEKLCTDLVSVVSLSGSSSIWRKIKWLMD